MILTPGAQVTVAAELTLWMVEDGPLILPMADARIALQTVEVDGQPAGLLREGDRLLLVGRWSVPGGLPVGARSVPSRSWISYYL